MEGVDFANPDLVAYAKSFGARAHRIERADELLPVLRSCLENDAVSLVDCPIDCRENAKLNQALGAAIYRD